MTPTQEALLEINRMREQLLAVAQEITTGQMQPNTPAVLTAARQQLEATANYIQGRTRHLPMYRVELPKETAARRAQESAVIYGAESLTA